MALAVRVSVTCGELGRRPTVAVGALLATLTVAETAGPVTPPVVGVTVTVTGEPAGMFGVLLRSSVSLRLGELEVV